MILLSDPQISAIASADNGEPLIDVREVPELRWDIGPAAAVLRGVPDELRRKYPQWTAGRLHVEASKHVSPPEVAPHGTGGRRAVAKVKKKAPGQVASEKAAKQPKAPIKKAKSAQKASTASPQ